MPTPARLSSSVLGPAAFLLVTATASSASAASENVLRVATPQVPLVKEGIIARLDHRWAVTDHHQVARNASGGQAEGTYVLTTVDRSAVTSFTYWNGGEPIRGELFERDAAAQMYDTVTRARRDPGILEEVSPDTYRYRIFPFEGGEMKRIELRWETWLPARGRIVEYRAPLALPQSSVVVMLGESLRGAVVRSPTHEIVVEPSAHGETRVRTVEPRSANPTELILQYELPNAAETAFVDLDKNGDAFVVIDFEAPNRIVDQVKVEIEGATGVVHALPVPATLSNERATLAFRCHPNPGVSTIKAKVTGMLDGRATTMTAQAVDVSPRGRSAPWASRLWGLERIEQLSADATRPGAPLPSREEIVELAFEHDMVSPFTAFFAIPASEATRVQGQLADARRRKRWLSADATDGATLAGSPGIERQMVEPSLTVERPRGGCAGCVTSPSESRGSFAGSLLLSAIVVAGVRRRARSRGPGARAACAR